MKRACIHMLLALSVFGCGSAVTIDESADDDYVLQHVATNSSVPDGVLGGYCLEQAVPTLDDGRVACRIVEGRETSGTCECGAGRVPASPEHDALIDAIVGFEDWDLEPTCFCEVVQLAGDEGAACREAPWPTWPMIVDDPEGWCYVDERTMGDGPCPRARPQVTRFVGEEMLNAPGLFAIDCRL